MKAKLIDAWVWANWALDAWLLPIALFFVIATAALADNWPLAVYLCCLMAVLGVTEQLSENRERNRKHSKASA
jgi:hypothetical protein